MLSSGFKPTSINCFSVIPDFSAKLFIVSLLTNFVVSTFISCNFIIVSINSSTTKLFPFKYSSK